MKFLFSTSGLVVLLEVVVDFVVYVLVVVDLPDVEANARDDEDGVVNPDLPCQFDFLAVRNHGPLLDFGRELAEVVGPSAHEHVAA